MFPKCHPDPPPIQAHERFEFHAKVCLPEVHAQRESVFKPGGRTIPWQSLPFACDNSWRNQSGITVPKWFCVKAAVGSKIKEGGEVYKLVDLAVTLRI